MFTSVFVMLLLLWIISSQWGERVDVDPIHLQIFYFAGMIFFFLSFILSKPLAQFLRKETDLPRNALSVCLVHWSFLIAIAVIGIIATVIRRELFTFYPFFGLTVLGLVISYPRDSSMKKAN